MFTLQHFWRTKTTQITLYMADCWDTRRPSSLSKTSFLFFVLHWTKRHEAKKQVATHNTPKMSPPKSNTQKTFPSSTSCKQHCNTKQKIKQVATCTYAIWDMQKILAKQKLQSTMWCKILQQDKRWENKNKRKIKKYSYPANCNNATCKTPSQLPHYVTQNIFQIIFLVTSPGSNIQVPPRTKAFSLQSQQPKMS